MPVISVSDFKSCVDGWHGATTDMSCEMHKDRGSERKERKWEVNWRRVNEGWQWMAIKSKIDKVSEKGRENERDRGRLNGGLEEGSWKILKRPLGDTHC